jgi:hypothetical protein
MKNRKPHSFFLALAASLVAGCSGASSGPDVILATMDIVVGPEGPTVQYGAADGSLGAEGPLRIRVYAPDENTLSYEVRGETYAEAMEMLYEKAESMRQELIATMESGTFITEEDIRAMTVEQRTELRQAIAEGTEALESLKASYSRDMTPEERAALRAEAEKQLQEMARSTRPSRTEIK